MQATSPPKFTCPECSATFGKAQHLKRHTLTHSGDKPHACQFCDTRYKRSDALRRHWKTCKERVASGNHMPTPSAAGKRKQACVQCSSRKRACSLGQPCSECSVRYTDCIYEGSHGPGAPETDAQVESGSLSARSVDLERRNASPGHERQDELPSSADTDTKIASARSIRPRFGFLLNFTQASGLDEAYNWRASITDCGGLTDVSPEPFKFDNSALSTFFDDELHGIGLSPCGLEPSHLYDDCYEHDRPLMAEKTNQLWETIKPLLEDSAFRDFRISSLEVLGFFSPQNMVRYLNLFWTRFSRHCPIIHKPTFDLKNCSTSLFATIALVGACVSPQGMDHQGAKQMLDLIEELLFSSPLLSDMSAEREKLKSVENVQTLQAACFMTLLQKWEGNQSAKMRMQRSRFTTFVAATRAMGLSQGIHRRRSFSAPVKAGEWRDYILQEELIRTFNHAFLLDSAFVIFHNSVPRMVLQEMSIDLTCPEDVFQASNPEEFLIAVESHPRPPKPPLLTDCVRNLCAENPHPAIIEHLHKESALNLFTIATAIHGLIFHQLRAFSFPLATRFLENALDRWEDAWIDSTKNSTDLDDTSPKSAFFHRAREFASLARVQVEKSRLSTENLNNLAQESPESETQDGGGLLSTFDQTNMDPVASLMLAVENLNLN